MVKTCIRKVLFIRAVLKNDIGLQQLSGKNLSYNNYNDIFAGLDILNSNLTLQQ